MKSLQTIQTTIKVFMVISLVAMILSFAGAASMLGGVGVLLADEKDLIDSETAMFLINDVAGREERVEALAVLWCGAVLTITDGIMLSAVFSYLRKELKDGTPFTERGARQVRHLGVKVIVLSFVASVVCGVICGCYGVAAPDNIMNLTSVTFGIALIIVSLILKYGAELAGNRKG